MRSGQFRTKVTFQKESKLLKDRGGGYDGRTGEDGQSIPAKKIVYCRYIAQSGRESVEGGEIQSQVKAVLQARASSVAGITAGWTAYINNEPWNIRSVTPFGQKNERVDMTIELGVAV